jgi:hypothetical protein
MIYVLSVGLTWRPNTCILGPSRGLSGIIIGPAIIVRARLLTLSGYWTVNAAKVIPFRPSGTYAVPVPAVVIFRGVYIGA